MEMIAALFDFVVPGRVKDLLHRAATAKLNRSIDERDWLIRYTDARGISLLEAEREVAQHLDECLA